MKNIIRKPNGGFLIFLSAVFWGSAGLFVTPLRDTYGIKELGIIFGRSFFTVLTLGIYMLFFDKNSFKIKLKDAWLFAVCGIVSIFFFNFCYYKTMALTSLSVAAVLMYTAPIFVMIISVLFLGEKLTFKKSICCITAVIGCALVSGIAGAANGINAKGLLFGLLTGFGYSLYGIFSSFLIKRGYNSYTINFYAFVFVFLTDCIFISSNLKNTVLLYTVSYEPILIIFGMALVNTVIPYILYSNGLKSVNPTVAIIIATVEPVVATVIDIIVYKELPSIFAVIGIILVLSSVLLLNIGGVKADEIKGECKDKLNA